jgi:hypothetical protein
MCTNLCNGEIDIPSEPVGVSWKTRKYGDIFTDAKGFTWQIQMNEVGKLIPKPIQFPSQIRRLPRAHLSGKAIPIR